MWPTHSLCTRVPPYQMAQAQYVCQEPRKDVQRTPSSGTTLPSGGATSQHDVGLQNQVYDVSAHPLFRQRKRAYGESTLFRMVRTSSPSRGMASSIYQRSVGPDLDSLIAWAQSLLPAKPAAADATKKAKANWAATPKIERRALALLFLGGGPPVQPTASQPENLGQLARSTGPSSRGTLSRPSKLPSF